MPKELIFVGPRELAYREYADRALRNREIRIKMVCSGISHGTEMAMYRGTAAQLHGFVSTDRSNLSYPFVYGYEEVGEVVEVGEAVEEFTLGELVCSWLGHRETGIIDIDALDRRWGVTLERVPPNCRREEGVFMSLACVALEALLGSGLRIGESTVIFGQGVVGLLLTRLCSIMSVEPIVVVDLIDLRLEKAKEMGATHCLNPATCDVAFEARRILGPNGADIVFDVTGQTRALNEALKCGVPRPKVIAVGWYQTEALGLYLGESFCLEGGQILEANSAGFRDPVLPGKRWNKTRVARVVSRLWASGKLEFDGLITHRFSFSQAAEAFRLIDTHPEEVLKVILEF